MECTQRPTNGGDAKQPPPNNGLKLTALGLWQDRLWGAAA
jgi:hypothetical protein